MKTERDVDGEVIGEVLQFVTFELRLTGHRLTMALNVQKIKEVVEYSELSAMPENAGPLRGVYDLRGYPVPVLDLDRLLGTGGKKEEGSADAPTESRLLICELQRVYVGIPVARTGRMVTCPTEDFLPPPPGGGSEDARLITGLIRRDSKYIPVLDLDSLLETCGLLIPRHSQRGEKAAPRFSGKTVLIVDDSKVILKRLVKVFQTMGFTVLTATNGKEGIEQLDRTQAPVDLIFTDIEMPLLDGVGMARGIKANPKTSKVPILFNSALSNPALIQDIEREQLGHYLVKFDEDLIQKHVEIIFGLGTESGSTAGAA